MSKNSKVQDRIQQNCGNQGSFPMGTTGNGVPIPFLAVGTASPTASPHLFERCGTNLYQISIRCRPVREKLLANHRTASDNRSETLAKNDIGNARVHFRK